MPDLVLMTRRLMMRDFHALVNNMPLDTNKVGQYVLAAAETNSIPIPKDINRISEEVMDRAFKAEVRKRLHGTDPAVASVLTKRKLSSEDEEELCTSTCPACLEGQQNQQAHQIGPGYCMYDSDV